MSTMTITAPLRRSGGPVAWPARPVTRPAAQPWHRPVAAARPAPARPAPARPAPARTSAPLQLTARGRAVLLFVLLVTALVVSLATGAVSLAGTSATAVPVQYVTVEAGETLWAIAAEVAPTADRRETIALIRELNALSSSAVRAGQQIAVPAAR